MENPKEHLSYLTIYDAAYKRKALKAKEWQHLCDCDECILCLAKIIQVRNDLLDMRNKYPA